MTDLNAGGSVEALVALVHVLLGRLVVELPDVLGQVLLRDRLKSNQIAVKEQNLDKLSQWHKLETASTLRTTLSEAKLHLVLSFPPKGTLKVLVTLSAKCYNDSSLVMERELIQCGWLANQAREILVSAFGIATTIELIQSET